MLVVHTDQRLHSSLMHDGVAMELTNKHLDNKTLYSDKKYTWIPRVLVKFCCGREHKPLNLKHLTCCMEVSDLLIPPPMPSWLSAYTFPLFYIEYKADLMLTSCLLTLSGLFDCISKILCMIKKLLIIQCCISLVPRLAIPYCKRRKVGRGLGTSLVLHGCYICIGTYILNSTRELVDYVEMVQTHNT